jgi:NAD(P)-dependent dehydrogenase (short-subunit alcohol dehydrogenase family)
MDVSGSSNLLAGKVLFIAGVGPQMGTGTALVAAREGASVVLTARREKNIIPVAETIRANGGEALALKCDLANAEDLAAAVEASMERFGKVDTVFYNAAAYDDRNETVDIDEALWQSTMAVNFGGALTLARLTIPSMIENGRGAFVFNSSAASMVAEDVRLGYGVSKAALNALTRFIASKYGRNGIRANAILPFVIGGDVGAVASSINCLGRSGTAEEIGEAVVFLCSDRSSIITGEVIHLDGGLFNRAAWPSVAARRIPPPAK